ncbi:MAG: UDP-glucuronic acid decarboxylase family protein [Patescibacteria group bacterium]
MTQKKTSVVTGGAGFIGSHLCEALLAHGHQVFCLDNLLTGAEENLIHAKKNPNFTFIRIDVTEKLPILGKIDYIFHLASPASPRDYQNYAEETALVNSVGTRNLLRLAKSYGARFLFASTSEVYGEPLEHPQRETYWGNVNPNGPRSCYDESKRFGEMITMVYVRKYGVDARIARIFNTYGERMQPEDGRVVSNFVNQALNGKPLTIYGDGSQTRSFCYVSDLVAGLLRLMFTDDLAGEVVNLGNPEEYPVLELAGKIKQLAASNSKIIYKPLPPDDPSRRRPDITKAKKLLGWEPKISLEKGLKKTIQFYKNQ